MNYYAVTFWFFEIRKFGSSKLGARNLKFVTRTWPPRYNSAQRYYSTLRYLIIFPYDTSLPYDTSPPYDLILPYDTLLFYDTILSCDTILPYETSLSYDAPQPCNIPYPTIFSCPTTFLTLRCSSILRYLIRVHLKGLIQPSRFQPVSGYLLCHPNSKRFGW